MNSIYRECQNRKSIQTIKISGYNGKGAKWRVVTIGLNFRVLGMLWSSKDDCTYKPPKGKLYNR